MPRNAIGNTEIKFSEEALISACHPEKNPETTLRLKITVKNPSWIAFTMMVDKINQVRRSKCTWKMENIK